MYWDSAIGVYEVMEASTSGENDFTKELATDGTDAGKSYNFQISALNTIGESDLSDEYMVVSATIPDPPFELTRNEVLTSKTTLSFVW